MECQPGSWWILSAKHGLLDPARVIEPYDESLLDVGHLQRRDWAASVALQLLKQLRAGDRVILLAGKRYREYLTPHLEEHGCKVEAPLASMAIGKQVQWLQRRARA